MVKVLDMKGVEIIAGQSVKVHQDDAISYATVIDTFDGSMPTEDDTGHWVDIDKGKGPEGMMSFILEVVE